MDESDDVIVITLPLPHEVLHPNGRTRDYKWKSSLQKAAREDAHFVARGRKNKTCPWKRANFQAQFYMPRKRDDDGLASWLKAYRDGIADAGIIANDSGFIAQPVTQITGKDAGRRVVITLTRIE